jgi:hypothetical protein
LACATASSLRGQQHDAATTIRLLEHQWSDAQSHNDNRTLDLLLDNAVVYIEYGQVVTKGDYLLRIKQQPPGIDEIQMDPISIQTFGKTAVVTGSYREIQRTGGKRSLQRWRFVDTWTYKKNGWVLVAAASTPIRE